MIDFDPFLYKAESSIKRKISFDSLIPVKFLAVVAISLTSLISLTSGSEVSAIAAATAPIASLDSSNKSTLIQSEEVDPLFNSPSELKERVLPSLDKVTLSRDENGVYAKSLPSLNSRFAGRIAALTPKNEFVFYTIDPYIQDFVTSTIKQSRSKHVAIVVMDPKTGRVLAVGGKSPTISEVWSHAGFPAASLFKVITAAAAIENKGVEPESLVSFRGGNYSLNTSNYKPNARLDNRTMTIGEALGKSCNPVFGRIALQLLSPGVLRKYAKLFGFNKDVQCDIPVDPSRASIPEEDYELSRTGAGFGEVTISPVHAASMMSAIANKGQMLRPTFIDRVVSPTGIVTYRSKPSVLEDIVNPTTAKTLLRMMEYTITDGTSRKEFMKRSPRIQNLRVAGKTGSLTGKNPKGFNNWFIGTAPIENPKVAVAAIVVDDNGLKTKASHLGRLVIEKFFS